MEAGSEEVFLLYYSISMSPPHQADSCTIHLKLATTMHELIDVGEHDVPFLTSPIDVVLNHVLKHKWDLTTQQVGE